MRRTRTVQRATLLLLLPLLAALAQVSAVTVLAAPAAGAPARPGVSGPVTGPGSAWTATTDSGQVAERGYTEREFFLDGTATSYRPKGRWGEDGMWAAEPDAQAAYRTRVLVRAPADPARFNGTVVVEWLNVSAGFESAPDWLYLREEILRGGYAWVGVSAQAGGVDGPVTPFGIGPLKQYAPERYASLNHPGDAWSYDIYGQVATAVRAPGDGTDLLDGLPAARTVLAVGQSQSAFRLTTFINAVQPLTGAYDGFLVHSRFGSGAPPGDGMLADGVARLRTDLAAPVLVAESETDVGYHLPARQPDSATYRLWETPGTSHVDAYAMAGALGCERPVNAGPQTYVMRAALRGLRAWVVSGVAPPSADRVATGAGATLARDAHGNALGGIRTPQLDVPVATLSGEGNTGAGFCFLAGTTTALPDDTLRALYPTHDAYVGAFGAALDRAVAAGFLLADDAAEMLAAAEAAEVPPGGGRGPGQDLGVVLAPGPLTMSQEGSSVTLGQVTLDGTEQTMTGRLNQVRVEDLRGSSLGWELTGRVSDFTNENGTVIEAGRLSWTPECARATDASPGGVRAGGEGPVGAGALLCAGEAGTAGELTGGVFTADAGLRLALPAYPEAGGYVAVLTLTLA